MKREMSLHLLIVNRLHPGPGRSLGRAIHHLLFHHRDIAHRGNLWTGLWAPQHRASSDHTYAFADSRRDNASFCNSAHGPPRL